MANRFFTILFIPEKTSPVRRIVIPGWILKSALAFFVLLGALIMMMTLDYWYVMRQIDENKNLKAENRRLTQQVQIFKNRIAAIEDTLDRVQTFGTRLKIITNIEDRDSIVEKLNEDLPDAASNVGRRAAPKEPDLTTEVSLVGTEEHDPETIRLRQEHRELNDRLSRVGQDALLVEQNLQDLYELLVDQKAFLAALPTRKPAVGYFTSGFGVRLSPYGGIEKMHEGLDIANRHGTRIFSTAHGIVRFAGRKPGYGRTVVVDHGYGLETWYGHTQKILVKQNQKVRRGESIALMGSTGRSTGPHVHYEVRVNGIPVDPLPYILEN